MVRIWTRRPGARRSRLGLVAVALAWLMAQGAQSLAQGSLTDEALKESTWNPLNRASAGHFRVADPANVGPDEAEAAYQALIEEMVAGYRLSGVPTGARYRSWPRYNSSPYQSVTHGRTYVNNYANDAAKAYGRYEAAGLFPQGAVLAKDSFTIDAEGEVRPGSLFLMEKMAQGFNPESGDWRYTQVLPDGSVLGTTRGENAGNVNYCVPCHVDSRNRDHVFFPRKPFRRALPADADQSGSR